MTKGKQNAMLKEKETGEKRMEIAFWEKAAVTEIHLAIHVPPDPQIM